MPLIHVITCCISKPSLIQKRSFRYQNSEEKLTGSVQVTGELFCAGFLRFGRIRNQWPASKEMELMMRPAVSMQELSPSG